MKVTLLLLFFSLSSISCFSQIKFDKRFFQNKYYSNIDFYWNENDADDSKYYNIGTVKRVYPNKYFNNDRDMTSEAPAFVEILCTSGLNKGRKLNITMVLKSKLKSSEIAIFNNQIKPGAKIKFLIERYNDDVFYFSNVEILK
jgi:hypothetical protein